MQRRRSAPARSARAEVERFDDGLTTPEVATLMTSGNDAPDPAAAAAWSTQLERVVAGRAVREPLGDGALEACAMIPGCPRVLI